MVPTKSNPQVDQKNLSPAGGSSVFDPARLSLLRDGRGLTENENHLKLITVRNRICCRHVVGGKQFPSFAAVMGLNSMLNLRGKAHKNLRTSLLSYVVMSFHLYPCGRFFVAATKVLGINPALVLESCQAGTNTM